MDATVSAVVLPCNGAARLVHLPVARREFEEACEDALRVDRDGDDAHVTIASSHLGKVDGFGDESAFVLLYDDMYRLKRKPYNAEGTVLLRSLMHAGANAREEFMLGHAVLRREARRGDSWVWVPVDCTLADAEAVLKAARARVEELHLSNAKLVPPSPSEGDTKLDAGAAAFAESLAPFLPAGVVLAPVRFEALAGMSNAIHKLERKQAKGTAAPCSRPGCELPAYQRCARCQTARYCSAACQRAHWRVGHKSTCTPKTAGSTTTATATVPTAASA